MTDRGEAMSSKAEQEVSKVHSERLQALVQGDLAKLDQIVGDDLVYISPTGQVQTKAEVVADRKSGALKVSAIEAEDVQVRVYGETAVVTYRTINKGFLDNGKDFSGQIRATSVYVKRDGRWQLVSQQMTRIAQP